MMIHFRRNALRVTVAALLSSAFGAQAADIPQVKVTVNDKQCEPMQVTVNAGKTQFIIQNHSQKALEWEILKGVMVVEERENIAPRQRGHRYLARRRTDRYLPGGGRREGHQPFYDCPYHAVL